MIDTKSEQATSTDGTSMANRFIIRDEAHVPRCWWSGSEPIYLKYHDQEWGKPIKNDRILFEKICLEGFQAGLSWLTILKKRENFRDAFANFDWNRVARFSQKKQQQLLENTGIIRHRGKIEATINNARRAMEMKTANGTLASFFWQFEPNKRLRFDKSRATCPESVEMSKRLKQLGWKFVGPTTCYSFMQAMGMVNDHHPGCHRYEPIEVMRRRFKRP